MRYLHVSQIVLWSVLSVLFGVGQAPIWVLWLITCSALAYYRWRKQPITVTTIMAALLLWSSAWYIGLLRYESYVPTTEHVPYGNAVEFVAEVAKPPVRQHTSQKLYVRTDKIPGYVYIKTGLYPYYSYGESLIVHCTLLEPEPFDTFAFDKYLARHKVFTICQQAKITSTGIHGGNPVYGKLYAVRGWFTTQIQQLWPEPVASLLLGVILGIQDSIPDDIVEQFRATGTIHILVVSGMHVVIISQLLINVLRRWFSPITMCIVVGIVLFGFCVITGLQASVVRAAIMGMLPILVIAFQRRQIRHYSLVAVAGIMVMHNPYILLHDAGFQLSFLATLGLMYFQPMCERMCWWVPPHFTLRETLSTTLAASLATTPLLLSTFGMISFVSILANVIVVPVSNIMLFGGFGIIMLAQVIPDLAQYTSYILWWLVAQMLNIVDWLSTLPFAMVTDIATPTWFVYASFGLILSYILWNIHVSTSSVLD